jgi:hypothetical protein
MKKPRLSSIIVVKCSEELFNLWGKLVDYHYKKTMADVKRSDLIRYLIRKHADELGVEYPDSILWESQIR